MSSPHEILYRFGYLHPESEIFFELIKDHKYTKNVYTFHKVLQKQIPHKKIYFHGLGRILENLYEYDEDYFQIKDLLVQYWSSRLYANKVLHQLIHMKIPNSEIQKKFESDEYLRKNISLVKAFSYAK